MHRKTLHSLGVGGGIDPGADRDAQAPIVPPRGMEAGQRSHDGLALRHGGWQRPFRGHCVRRRAHILQHEMPGFAFLVPRGVEAAGHEALRHQRGDLAIEGDFLSAGDALGVRLPGHPGLEDHRARGRAVIGLIGQAQPQDARRHRREGVFDVDLADPAVGQRAGAAKRVGEMLGVCRLGKASAVTAARYHAVRRRAKPVRPNAGRDRSGRPADRWRGFWPGPGRTSRRSSPDGRSRG